MHEFLAGGIRRGIAVSRQVLFLANELFPQYSDRFTWSAFVFVFVS